MEACGFLLAPTVSCRSGTLRIVEAVGARNAENDSPFTRFVIAPSEWLRAEDDARRRGLEVAGQYHSHPDCDARPSDRDELHAWPEHAHLIVSVRHGRVARLAGYEARSDTPGMIELPIQTTHAIARVSRAGDRTDA